MAPLRISYKYKKITFVIMVYSVLVSKYYFEKYFSVECNVTE